MQKSGGRNVEMVKFVYVRRGTLCFLAEFFANPQTDRAKEFLSKVL